MAESDLTPAQTEKLTMLTGLGLPEAQAKKSVATDAAGAPAAACPCSCYCMMKINEDGDIAAIKAALLEYSKNSQASRGKVISQHAVDEEKREVLFNEIYNGNHAMDNHIGNCFPHYIKMLPHCTMAEIIAICHPDDVAWWKESASAWGAAKFTVVPAINPAKKHEE